MELSSTESSANGSLSTITSTSTAAWLSTTPSPNEIMTNSTTSATPWQDSSVVSDVSSWTSRSEPVNWTSADTNSWTTSDMATTWRPPLSNTTDPMDSPQTPSSDLTSFSTLWPLNFTFGTISPRELYLPDDEGERNLASTIMASVLNLTSGVNASLDQDCGINVTNCRDGPTADPIFTDDDVWAENEKFARKLIPAMVFIGVLMVFGIVGNLLVVYIYGYRFKSATQHFLIVCLACFDLLMSCIAMPTEIADLRFHHMFSSLFACKLLRFITMFSSISSSFTLVTIAMDRHRRVTRPLAKQMTVRRARIWEAVNVIGALFFSWPLLVMTGLRSSETSVPGLFGTDCSFSDDFRMTKWPLAYNAVLGAGFIVLTVVIGILYFRIWKTARGHRVYMANKSRGSFSGTSMCDVRNNGSVDNLSNGTPRIYRSNAQLNQDHDQAEPDSRHISQSFTPEERSSRQSLNEGEPPRADRVVVFSELRLFRPSSQDNEDFSHLSAHSCHQKQDAGVFSASPRRSKDDFRKDGNLQCKPLSEMSKVSVGENHSLSRKSKSLDNLVSISGQVPFHKVLTTPSLSTHKGILASALSGHSRTPSPKLRSRSLKVQSSYNSSIKSDDLRPMSSLLESVSKTLLASGTLASAVEGNGDSHAGIAGNEYLTKDILGTKESVTHRTVITVCTCSKDRQTFKDTGIGRYLSVTSDESQFRDSGIMCSSCVDVNSSLESQQYCGCLPWHGTARKDVQPVAVEDEDKENLPAVQPKDSDLSNNSPTFAAPGTKTTSNQTTTSSYLSGSDETNQGNNSSNTQTELGVSDSLPLGPKEGRGSIQNKDDVKDESPRNELELPEFTQASFMEMVAKSDFSHLITPRSKPMAIPNEEVEDFDMDVNHSLPTGQALVPDEGGQSTREVPTTTTTTSPESPAPSSPLQCRFRAHDLRDRSGSENSVQISSPSANNKRRSTVVSVLERYRFRAGSMVSLDNITSTSTKTGGRRISKSFDKTTIVAFVISSVFVLSFLPYLILMFIRSFVKDFDYNLDDARLCVYNIFLRFYLINSAVNPLMYGLLNQRFRHECRRLFACFLCKNVKK